MTAVLNSLSIPLPSTCRLLPPALLLCCGDDDYPSRMGSVLLILQLLQAPAQTSKADALQLCLSPKPNHVLGFRARALKPRNPIANDGKS